MTTEEQCVPIPGSFSASHAPLSPHATVPGMSHYVTADFDAHGLESFCFDVGMGCDPDTVSSTALL